LIKETMRVLALTRYERLGSSSRVRFYQYFAHLKEQGVEITCAPFFTDDYVRSLYTGKATSFAAVLRAYLQRVSVLIKSMRFEIFWVEKELFPWLPAWLEGLLSTRKIPYVVDYDDAVYHRYDLHPSSLVRAVLGHKIDRVMREAALVVVGNEYLGERARQAGAKRVEYLPSVVDVSRYVIKDSSLSASPVRIGWIGSPVTAPYLDGIREAVNQLSREALVQLVLIGTGNIDPFPDLQTQLQPWSEESELSIARFFDIGIMPLVDGPFERGKCGYKLVQYMAAGLPVVASPVGVNSQIVTPDIGYLANTTPEWLDALRKLGSDAELRLKMGQSGRQRAEQMYNLQRTAPQLLNLLSSVRRL